MLYRIFQHPIYPSIAVKLSWPIFFAKLSAFTFNIVPSTWTPSEILFENHTFKASSTSGSLPLCFHFLWIACPPSFFFCYFSHKASSLALNHKIVDFKMPRKLSGCRSVALAGCFLILWKMSIFFHLVTDLFATLLWLYSKYKKLKFYTVRVRTYYALAKFIMNRQLK